MSDTVRCPSCGTPNPADSDSCSSCNFPLRAASPPSRSGGEPPRIERPLPFRPRRAAPANNPSLTLWLVFGTVAAAVVIFVAIRSNVERASVPVEGATGNIQHEADSLRAVIAADSTDLTARNHLADLLYDTANWSDAIVEYRAVVRMDTTRVTAIVDLGVCYYNLGHSDQARTLFQQALRVHPGHPVALFNLGIVAENNDNDPEAALRYYHQAVEANPPANMMEPLTQAITRLQQKLGRQPPPLGASGGTPPSGR